MTLSEMITNDLARVFDTDEMAETVTYGGSEISAIVSHEADPDERDGGRAAAVILRVKVSDVASPAYRDSVVIGSDTWRVKQVLGGDGNIWRLQLERDERSGFRR